MGAISVQDHASSTGPTMRGREVLIRVAKQVVRNATGLVIAAWVIGSLAQRAPGVSKVGFWLYVGVVALDALRVAFLVVVPGIFVAAMSLRDRTRFAEVGWLTLASLIQVVEVALGLIGVGYAGAAVGYIGAA